MIYKKFFIFTCFILINFRQTKLAKRKFLILHEISHLRKFMIEKNLIELNDLLMDIFDDLNDFFGTYFKIIKDEHQKAITIPQFYNKCATTDPQNRKLYKFHFDKDFFWKDTRQYVDLVLFFQGEYIQKNSIIANAKPCQFDENNRAIVGKVILNLANFDFTKNQIYAYKNALNTIIHEIFHIIGFHPNFQINLPKRNINFTLYPYLNFLSKKLLNKQEIDQSVMNWYAHWETQVLQRDIMNPLERYDSIFTNFTKEYLEYINKGIYRIEYFYEQNQDLKELHGELIHDALFRCNDNKNSPNKNFCSLKDYSESIDKKNKDFYSKCSYNYKAKTLCNQKLKNNCYAKNIIFDSECQNTEKQSSVQGEIFADDSRCFETNKDSICLKSFIKNDQLTMQYKNQKLLCQHDYQQFEIGNLIIKCPHINHFMKNSQLNSCKNNCHLNGICYKDKCHCLKGYDIKTDCKDKLVSKIREQNMSIKYLKKQFI